MYIQLMVRTPSPTPAQLSLEQDETNMVNEYAKRMGKVIRTLEKMFPHSYKNSRKAEESFAAADGTQVEVCHNYSYYDPGDVNSLMAPLRDPMISKSGYVSLLAGDEDATKFTLRFNYPNEGDIEQSVDDGKELLTYRNARKVQPKNRQSGTPIQHRKFMKHHPDKRVYNTADVDPGIVLEFSGVLDDMLKYLEEEKARKEAASALMPKEIVKQGRGLMRWLFRKK